MIEMPSVVGVFVNSKGGVPKHPVSSMTVKRDLIVEDAHTNTKNHGGPEKVVCILAETVLKELRGKGHPIYAGSTGENLILSDIQPHELDVGVTLKIGEVVLQITMPTTPCWKIESSFINGDFSTFDHSNCPYQTRWYCRVISTGLVEMNQMVEIQ